jgi:hypothetical protein
VCGTAAILLRLSDQNDTMNKAVLIIVLIFIGFAMCMIMTPVLTEVFAAVEELDQASPGRFGQYGAFAQAVSNEPVMINFPAFTKNSKYALFDIAYAGGAFIGPICGSLILLPQPCLTPP